MPGTKLSVCIPVYDVPVRYLREAIDSALRQQGPFTLEIVVSDDASPTDYSSLEREYGDDPVALFRNDRNLGMAGNWNAAVRRSSGDLVLVLGHDDVLVEGMFAAYVAAFAEHPDVVLCSSGRLFIDDQGRQVQVRRAVNDRANVFLDQDLYLLDRCEAIQLCLRNGNVIGEPSAVMFRRTAFDQSGGYDPDFEHAADVHFNLRAARHGRIAYFRERFLRRRIHPENLTKSNLAEGKLTIDRARLFETFAGECPFDSRTLATFRAHLVARSAHDALRAARSGRWRTAALGLRKALFYVRPTPRVYYRYVREILNGVNADAR